MFAETALFAGYELICERFALFELDGSAWPVWFAGLLGVDFCYYWFNRASYLEPAHSAGT